MFVAKFNRDYIIVTHDVYKALATSKIKGVYFKQLKTKRESDADRKQWESPEPNLPDVHDFPQFPAPTIEEVRAALAAEAARPGLSGFLGGTLGSKPKAKVTVGTGATKAAVAAAEKRLGVKLPDAYRSFVLDHGSADIEGVEVFGLGKGGTDLPPYEFDEYTMQERTGIPGIQSPGHMIAIAEDGRGGCYCLDLSKAKNGDCPVVYFDHELAEIDEKTGRVTPRFERIKPTFKSWIKAVAEYGEPGPF